jgi:hypothetical protein
MEEMVSSINTPESMPVNYCSGIRVAQHTFRGMKCSSNGCMFRWQPVSKASWICVDAYFMKGKWGGQLCVSIARDANNDIFLIAYVVCETENKDRLMWFLRTLLDDIGYQ